jgi:hypothetical protein
VKSTLRDNFFLDYFYRVRYKVGMAEQELTTTQAAERLKVANVTVRLWCRQGRFPNARAVDTPRGSLWYIPERDIDSFTQPKIGRPKTTPDTNKRATARIRASNEASTGKKGKGKK